MIALWDFRKRWVQERSGVSHPAFRSLFSHDCLPSLVAGAPEPALSLSKGLALFDTWDSTAA